MDKSLPVLVCLHGMTGDSRSFWELKNHLMEDFDLILLDLPGHGDTDPLPSEEDYHFTSLSKRIFELIQTRTHENFYIMGHSWGADLALHIAKEFPDRIEGLVLIDGGYVFPEMVEGLTKEKALSDWANYIDSCQYNSWGEIVNVYEAYTTRPWDKTLDSIISTNFKKVDDHYVLKADRQSLLAIIKAFYLEPCSTTYQYIECPVLLFHSTVPANDLPRQKGIEKIRNDLKKVTVTGIENTRHNIHWDCPERVAAEIRGWKNSM